MRRLNTRLLGGLVLAAGVSGGAVYALHTYQIHRHSGAFLREADRAEQAGRTAETIDHLRKYLLLTPDDTRVTERLARFLFDRRQYYEATLALGQVVQRDSQNEGARRLLVDASLNLKRYQDAQYQLTTFLLHSHPEEAPLWLQLGTCRQGLGNFRAAAQAYQTAITKDASVVSGYRQLSELLADHLNEGSQAVTLLNEMVVRNPSSSEAYLVRGQFLRRHSDQPAVQVAVLGMIAGAESQRYRELLQRALADAKRALERAPTDARTLVFAAEAALVNGSQDDAKQYAQLASKQDPKEPASYDILASIALRSGRTNDAILILQRGLLATGDDPDLLWILANIEIEARDLTQSRSLIGRLRKANGARPVVDFLDARVLVAESKWDEARRQIETLLGELRPWPQLYKEAQLLLGHCYAHFGLDELCVGACRAALETDPQWNPARLALAEALLKQGRTDQASVEFQKLKQHADGTFRASLPMLRLAILVNLSKAGSKEKWTAIEKDVDDVLKTNPSDDLVLMRAEVETAKGDVEGARRTLRAALAHHPQVISLWTGLIAIEVQQMQWVTVEKLLRSASDQVGDLVALRVAHAEYLVRRFGNSKASEIRALANPAATYSDADRVELAKGMARVALAIHDYDFAERLCNVVALAEPDNLQMHLLLLDLAAQTGRPEAMDRPLTRIQAMDTDGFYWRYGAALRLTVLGKRNKDPKLLDQALEQLSEARARRSNWSRIPLLAAEINDFCGRPGAAVENYLQAVELGERNPQTLSRAVRLLFEQKNYSKAEFVIRKLQEDKTPLSPQLARLASEVLAGTGDFDQALALARQSAATSNRAHERIWLGQLLRVAGRTAEAEVEFQKSVQMSRKDAAGWIALIQFYVTVKNIERAQSTLKEAKTAIDETQSPLALAYAYELVGQGDEIETRYDAAIKSAPQNLSIQKASVEFCLRMGELEKAQASLRNLIERSKAVSDRETTTWARRELAQILAGSGDYPRYLEAKALVEANLQEPLPSDLDRRSMALISAAFPSKENAGSAIHALEALAQQRTGLSEDDRIVLAKLYLFTNDWPKASKIFREVASQTQNPRYVAAYVESLISQNELDEAQTWLRRLEQLAPKDSTTDELGARLLASQKRYAESFQRIVGLFNPGPTDPDLRARLQLTAATRMEEMGAALIGEGNKPEAERFFAQAETYLQGPKGMESRFVPARIRFFIQHGRNEEAIAELERFSKNGDAANLDAACIAVCAQRTSDARRSERLERLLLKVGEERAIGGAWLALAELRGQSGRHDEEEQSYRRALALDPNHVVALNNLSYLLALRKKDLPEAIAFINRAIAKAGPRAALLDTRAVVEIASGHNTQALADVGKAVADEPGPQNLFHDAQVRLVSGEQGAASASWQKARKSGLTAADFHPLELGVYKALEAQFEARR